jgi:hypothetical protein
MNRGLCTSLENLLALRSISEESLQIFRNIVLTAPKIMTSSSDDEDEDTD